jgi:hypothetical protein
MIDGILYAFRKQTNDDANVMLNALRQCECNGVEGEAIFISNL